MSVKLTVARAQLGTALSLFIQDRDPISVHALACGGAEVMEGLAEQAGLETLSSHILATFPDVDFAKVKRLRNQYWNAIKHFYRADNRTAREDEELMADFSDAANDAVLFMGWLDYMQREARLPVEVQVFQVWWYATNESRMAPNVDPTPYRTIFPDIARQDRREQKRRLARTVEKYRKDRNLLSDPRTERGRLRVKTCPPGRGDLDRVKLDLVGSHFSAEQGRSFLEWLWAWVIHLTNLRRSYLPPCKGRHDRDGCVPPSARRGPSCARPRHRVAAAP